MPVQSDFMISHTKGKHESAAHPVVDKHCPPPRDQPLPDEISIVRASTDFPMRIVRVVRKELTIAAAQHDIESTPNFAVNQLQGNVLTASWCLRVVLPISRCGLSISSCKRDAKAKSMRESRFLFSATLTNLQV
jgi:hypothetical protein